VSEARLTNQLGATLSHNEDLGKQRDKAVTAERIARETFRLRDAEWKLLHQQASMGDEQTDEKRALLLQEQKDRENEAWNDRLQHDRKRDFEKIGELEHDITQLSKKLDDKDNQLRAAEEKAYIAKRKLDQSKLHYEAAAQQHREQEDEQKATNERLKAEVAEYHSQGAHNETSLHTAWVEINTLRAAHNALIKAKDDVEAERLHFELLNNDLQAQWEQDVATIEELKERLEEIHTINASNENFQADVERLTDMLAETHRTIMIKDERIANLEGQVQKERHRYLSAEEAADIAMPMSPQDEAPPMRFTSGDSLAAELDATDDYDMFEDEQYQHIEESRIIEVVNCAPMDPVRPGLTVDVNEVAAYSPFEAVRARLSVIVNEVGHVSPVAAVRPDLSIAVQEAGHVTPIAAVNPDLSIDVNETASYSPLEAARPTLSLDINETGHVTPIAAIHPSLSVDVNETASVQPFEVIHPKLSLAYNEIGRTSPVERKIHTTSASVQTDVETLASEISYASMLETFPVPPVEISTGTTSTQTETEATKPNTIYLDAAVVGTEPVEPAREPAAEIAFGAIHVSQEIEPLDSPVSEVPIAPELKTNSVMVTHDISPHEFPAPEVYKLATAPIQVAHEIEPLDTPVPEVFPAPKMTTAPIQVAHNISPRDVHALEVLPAPKMTTAPILVAHNISPLDTSIPEILPAPKMDTVATPLLQAPKPAKALFPSLLAFLTFLLAFICFKLYAENQALRSRATHLRAGAFGNGRHLFGVFPIAMDVGGTWFSEQVARYLSMGIMRFEDWAGISYVPIY
jgi:hypothetical protein